MWLSLLCPLSDFPYMLPCCAPLLELLGLVSLISLALLAVLLGRRAKDSSFLVVLRGKVVELARTGCSLDDHDVVSLPRAFLLRSGPRLVWIRLGAAELRGQLRLGQRLTVLGIPGAVQVAEEQLYRQPSRMEGVEAIRILPVDLRVDALLVAGLVTLLSIGLWLVILIASG